MAKQLGRYKIRINGTFQDTFQGVTFNPGGVKRNEQVTNFSVNFSEENAAAKLDFDASFLQSNSIKDLDLADATIQVQADTGQTWVMNHAFRSDVPDLPENGKVKYVFMSAAAMEIKA